MTSGPRPPDGRSGLARVSRAADRLHLAVPGRCPDRLGLAPYWLGAGAGVEPGPLRRRDACPIGVDVEVGGSDIPDRLGPLSLARVVLGAQAYRRLHLPVAVSGGLVGRARQS